MTEINGMFTNRSVVERFRAEATKKQKLSFRLSVRETFKNLGNIHREGGFFEIESNLPLRDAFPSALDGAETSGNLDPEYRIGLESDFNKYLLRKKKALNGASPKLIYSDGTEDFLKIEFQSNGNGNCKVRFETSGIEMRQRADAESMKTIINVFRKPDALNWIVGTSEPESLEQKIDLLDTPVCKDSFLTADAVGDLITSLDAGYVRVNGRLLLKEMARNSEFNRDFLTNDPEKFNEKGAVFFINQKIKGVILAFVKEDDRVRAVGYFSRQRIKDKIDIFLKNFARK